jgi:hypothetical protein
MPSSILSRRDWPPRPGTWWHYYGRERGGGMRQAIRPRRIAHRVALDQLESLYDDRAGVTRQHPRIRQGRSLIGLFCCTALPR